jgi:hypothetical protein
MINIAEDPSESLSIALSRYVHVGLYLGITRQNDPAFPAVRVQKTRSKNGSAETHMNQFGSHPNHEN